MEGKMSVIRDKFPKVQVTLTHGKLKLHNAYSDKWLFRCPADFAPGTPEFQ
jgi:alkyl hydroperoxide reductase subunit AhpC